MRTGPQIVVEAIRKTNNDIGFAELHRGKPRWGHIKGSIVLPMETAVELRDLSIRSQIQQVTKDVER